MTLLTEAEWDKFIAHHPNAHLLQTSAWGRLKSDYGWEAVHIANEVCGAQMLFRKLPLGFSIAYIPRGPVGEDWSSLQPEMDEVCRSRRAIFLKIDPDGWDDVPLTNRELFRPGKPIQPRRTILVSLSGTEEDWLARMKQKCRYNIRLAQKSGVVVRPSEDVAVFASLMTATAERDGFGVHEKAYYDMVVQQFISSGNGVMLFAEFEGVPLAAVIVLKYGNRAYYMYGASSDLERQRMPAYLVQWEAMRWAASQGCISYDLWGVPDEDLDMLEAQFTTRQDGLWGVYRFKRGFGGEVKRSPETIDRVYIPALYSAYKWYTRQSGGGAA